MYASGMSVREIQRRLQEIYAIDVSSDLVSTITDAVLERIDEWQYRPLPVIVFSIICAWPGEPHAFMLEKPALALQATAISD
jgi:transposase-like protein